MDLIMLHPKIVHFPIALIYVSAFFEILFLIYKKDFFGKVSVWLFYLGLLAGFFAAASGLLAENSLGHDSPNHDQIHVHRNWMLATFILWVIMAFAGFLARKQVVMRKFFMIPILIIVVVLTIGVDKGGKLVYKYGVGVNKEILKEPAKIIDDHSGHNNEDHHHK